MYEVWILSILYISHKCTHTWTHLKIQVGSYVEYYRFQPVIVGKFAFCIIHKKFHLCMLNVTQSLSLSFNKLNGKKIPYNTGHTVHLESLDISSISFRWNSGENGWLDISWLLEFIQQGFDWKNSCNNSTPKLECIKLSKKSKTQVDFKCHVRSMNFVIFIYKSHMHARLNTLKNTSGNMVPLKIRGLMWSHTLNMSGVGIDKGEGTRR